MNSKTESDTKTSNMMDSQEKALLQQSTQEDPAKKAYATKQEVLERVKEIAHRPTQDYFLQDSSRRKRRTDERVSRKRR